ncbi:MAG: hypothetical protein P8M25_12310 [Paracoccaceae bacterium]|nr:hypothetical protein [Paracoccaceae bacterium]
MSTFIPRDVQAGLDAARNRASRDSSRLKIKTGKESFRILRLWQNGFALEDKCAPAIRGFIDIYEGERHLYQCLVIASEDLEGERHFEFKRSTLATDRPPLDFFIEETAPVALLGSA